MKTPNHIVLFVAFSFLSSVAFGQEIVPNICGTITPDSTWEAWFSQKVQEYRKIKGTQRTLTEYNIPVIVHIIHNEEEIGANENITLTRVQSQIAVLNADFAGTNADIDGTPPAFEPFLSGDTGIRFCLAKVDTNGIVLPEEGIHRVNWEDQGWSDPCDYPGTQTGIHNFHENFNSVIKPATIWDPSKYLNIWVSECNNDFGFAYFPTGIGAWNGQFLNGSIETISSNYARTGIVIYWKVFGTIGFVIPGHDKGRTATHEVGHWLGLRHIFGDEECGNDYCYNTPRQVGGFCPPNTDCSSLPPGSNFGCPPFPFQVNGCGSNFSPNGEMWMNFMDYTFDECKYMFTDDQAERMQTAMSSGTYRAPLAYSEACANPCADLIVIAPSVEPNSIQSGDSVTVYFAEENNGNLQASPNYVSFHLSSNNILTPGLYGDIFLSDCLVTQSLAPLSQSTLISKRILIPSSVNPGTYYLFFSADGSQIVDECDELNNFATTILTVSDSILPSETGYRYWFNNQFSQAISVNHTLGNIFLLEDSISTTTLPQGLHTFNIAFKDEDDLWSSTISSMFLKMTSTYPSGSARYDYWFDNNFNSRIVKTIPSTSNLFLIRALNMGSLNPGLHSFSIRLKPDGKHWSSTISSLFYKLDDPFPAGPSQYEYWFDQNYAGKTNLAITASTNLLLLDSLTTTPLSSGLHTFNIRFKLDGRHWSSSVSNLFYKVDNTYPAGGPHFEYWFDNSYSARVVDSITSTENLMILDSFATTGLADGLHTFHLRSKPDGKHWSTTTSDLFYKVSDTDGDIIKYQYWFDFNFQDTVTVSVPATENLQIIAQIDSLDIPNGLHSFHIRHLQSKGLWSSVTSDLFYKNDPDIPNNRIVKFVYWYDHQWQNAQTLYLPGLPNDSLTVYLNAEDLAAGDHAISMYFGDVGDKRSSIIIDTFSKTEFPIVCPFDNKLFTAGIGVNPGTTFQWQVDTGSGYVNVVNDGIYAGAATDSLHLTSAPTSWYGNKYRCQITDSYGTTNSEQFTLRFSLTWDGSEGTAWEDPMNWGCATVPDAYTDVYINTGSPNYPEVNVSTSCRSLKLKPGAHVMVKTGNALTLTGSN